MTPRHLLRYTDLTALIDILAIRRLTLLQPGSWDDRSDRRSIEAYRSECGYASVLALCFSEARPTFHHWRVFAPGNSGVCLQLNFEVLRSALAEQDVRLAPVRYATLNELRAAPPSTDDLPFVKQSAFRDEREWRALWQSATEARGSLAVTLPIQAIERVTLSPSLPAPLDESIKDTLRSIPGCEKLRVYRSQLLSNDAFEAAGGVAP